MDSIPLSGRQSERLGHPGVIFPVVEVEVAIDGTGGGGSGTSVRRFIIATGGLGSCMQR